MKKLAVLTLTAACLLIFAAPVLATTTVSLEEREVVGESLEMDALPSESSTICVLLDDPDEAEQIACPESVKNMVRAQMAEKCGEDEPGMALIRCYSLPEHPNVILLEKGIVCGEGIEVIQT